jgi:hypothetical protein
MNIPDNFSESFVIIIGLKNFILWCGFGIRNGKFGSGINIPDSQHSMYWTSSIINAVWWDTYVENFRIPRKSLSSAKKLFKKVWIYIEDAATVLPSSTCLLYEDGQFSTRWTAGFWAMYLAACL